MSRLLRKPKDGCVIVCHIGIFGQTLTPYVSDRNRNGFTEVNCACKNIQLNLADPPEFDEWQWVSYWYPLGQVVNFKRDVYRKAMVELCTQLPVQQLPKIIYLANDFY